VTAAIVSAPGKLFLVGEYGVLAGGTAVVAAVDRRAVGRFVAGAQPSSPLVAEAVRLACAHLAANGIILAAGAADIDTSAMSGAGGKLGVGSSAAAAAVAVGATLLAGGHDPEAEPGVSFAIAERAHRDAQGGRGSGADVAAAVYGGIIAYRRETDVESWEGPTTPAMNARAQSPAAVARLHVPAGIRELSPLPGLEIVVFHAGAPHATVDAIRAVEALAARDRPRYERHIAAISAAADAFLTAWEACDVAGVIEAADAAGGAAKPSGAGGGDVGVAFLTDEASAATFRARAPHIGVEILSIRTAARGLGRGTQ
jgi:phosphomevalonate kinase